MKFLGYIEGYYGRMLSWEERGRILSGLERHNLNSFFYCPKEDSFHRTNWKEFYSDDWMNQFKVFISMANKKNIKIIFGISPGLGFTHSTDINLLINKIKSIQSIGIEHVAILFDDLFQNSSGVTHAEIVNQCVDEFKTISFLTVPQEYSLSQAKPDILTSLYLKDFNETLNPKVPIFWTGNQVVSKYSSVEDIQKWINVFKRPIIFWDNYYANDYCVPKIILESYQSLHFDATKLLEGIMINPTGLVEVDEICIDFFGNFINKDQTEAGDYFKDRNLPNELIKILPLFKFKINLKEAKINLKDIETLLWSWHHPLKFAIYPYLHMLRFMLLQKEHTSLSSLRKRFRIIN